MAESASASDREAALLEMSDASVGRLIDRLCTEGLLMRHSEADDRRAHQIYLTNAANDRPRANHKERRGS